MIYKAKNMVRNHSLELFFLSYIAIYRDPVACGALVCRVMRLWCKSRCTM